MKGLYSYKMIVSYPMIEIKSKMPKIETLRKYYPECTLSDDVLMKIAEFVKTHEQKEHISPDNKIVAAIIAWEIR